MKIPITQSEAWHRLQEDLNEESTCEKGNGYQFLAIYKSTPLGKYLYLPYGPVAKDDEAFKKALNALDKLARRSGAMFIRTEPTNPQFGDIVKEKGIKVKDINPADTWLLDLTPDEATLKKNFSQGTRTRFNTYPKKGLVVTKSDDKGDIDYLVTLQKSLYDAKHLNAFSKEYLSAELDQPFASLYLVRYDKKNDIVRKERNVSEKEDSYPDDGQVLAASLFFDYNDTRYYMQSATDQHYRKLPANVALLTKAIFDAKEKGIKEFDFWGIAPDGAKADHPWAGFTDFKKSFGGEPRHYAGTYDIVVNPIKYRLYTIIRKINQMRRRLK